MAKTPELDIRDDYGRNYIINGNFDFDQRNAGSIAGMTVAQFTADRFRYSPSSSAQMDYTLDSDVPTLSESGFKSVNSLKLEVAIADASIAAGEFAILSYKMEGFDFAPLHNKRVVLSFWAKSNKTGSYGVGFRNDAQNRRYISEYTIDSPNTWEKKELSFLHDDTGTWEIETQTGLDINFTLAAGTSLQATADSWDAGAEIATSNQVNFLDTIGNTIQIAQVQLSEGTEALPFRRAGRSIKEELDLCRRYYYRPGFGDISGSTQYGQFQAVNSSNAQGGVTLPVPMRANFSVSFGSLLLTNSVSASAGGVTAIVANLITPETCRFQITVGAPFGLAAGNATILQRTSSAGFLEFDAEL